MVSQNVRSRTIEVGCVSKAKNLRAAIVASVNKNSDKLGFIQQVTGYHLLGFLGLQCLYPRN